MKKIYIVLENFVEKIFAKRVLVAVIKTILLLTGLIVFFYGFNVDFIIKYLIVGLFSCLWYVLIYHINEFLKVEEEYLKKIFSK
ncbi:hypothetical protein [Aliarcobacter butzleri]|uniref:hypothetical protein n=1 Tax=Aliarcobacter butzleri TaxID=28197 RepID=UPI002B24545D|nr:hypothetical protein [Aliarcobacter butzleri]